MEVILLYFEIFLLVASGILLFKVQPKANSPILLQKIWPFLRIAMLIALTIGVIVLVDFVIDYQ